MCFAKPRATAVVDRAAVLGGNIAESVLS